MKCKHCNGTGATNWYVNRAFVTCPYCGGTGEMEGNMTNEEWFNTLTTEEKAEFLKQIIKSCGWCLDGGNPPFCLLSGNKCFFNDGEFVEWLKGEHHD